MKSFFLALGTAVMLLCSSTTARAAGSPIDAGNYILAGDVGLIANLGTGGGTTLFIDPTLLYFIQERLALGGTLGLRTGSGYTQFSLLPTAGYFFGDRNAKMLPFVRAGLGIATGGGSTDFIASFGGGAAWMLNRNVCINSTLTVEIFGSSTSLMILGGIGVFLP